MKTMFFLFCVLCASAAAGQNAVGAGALNAQPAPLTFPSRPEHASQKPMGREESIIGNSANVSAHGERPLLEFASKRVDVPLGDIARELKKDHTVAKKSTSVFEKPIAGHR